MDSGEFAEQLDEVFGMNPIRLAWGVILVAFAFFCISCAASVVGTYYFLFESSLSLETILHVGRGTAGVRQSGEVERAETGHRILATGTVVRTDQTDLLSQAYISLSDPTYHNQLIASVTLKGNTSVYLRSSARPRYRWSSTTYHGTFDITGEADVFIAGDLNRAIRITFHTPEGVEVRLESSGRYRIIATGSQVQVINRTGQAVLIAPDRLKTQSISEGQMGRLVFESNQIQVTPASVDLVTNSALDPFDPSAEGSSSNILDRLIGWSCTNGPPNNLPTGEYRAEMSPDGRLSFRLVRAGGADTNGYTRCEQKLGPANIGTDVTGYDYLIAQTTFYIHYQSLSRCGTQASECPLMLLIRFLDANGQPGEWIQGIYTREDAGVDYRLRCDTCFDNHIRVYPDAWYIYTSNNLFDVFPPDRRPVAITDVIFHAEGHQYDVFVDEVALLAGHTITAVTNGE